MRVIVSGRLKVRQYETREGGKGTSVECDVDDVGPALKYATAKVTKVSRSGGGDFGGGGGNFGGGSGGGAPQGSPADDPWATNAPSAPIDEPPF